jgi:hypothetical protein
MTSPRHSVAVILALVGLLLAAPAASAQALFYVDGLEVYDSTGKQVGTRSNWRLDEEMEVVFRTGAGHMLFVGFSASSFFGNVGALYFSERDCRGLPFIARSYTGRPPTWVGGQRQTVYVQAGAFSQQRITSYRSGGTVGDCRNFGETSSEVALAARAGVDLADYFTPPFALRATPGEPIPTGAAEPLARTDGLVRVDSTGKKLAALAADVVVTDSGITLPLSFLPHYFSTVDCTGTPFVEVRPNRPHLLLGAVTLVGPRQTVYRQTSATRGQTMYSYWAASGECKRLRFFHGGGHEVGFRSTFAPTASIGIDFADYFTGPFTWRAGRGIRKLPSSD